MFAKVVKEKVFEEHEHNLAMRKFMVKFTVFTTKRCRLNNGIFCDIVEKK